jgi:hypothetical protein
MKTKPASKKFENYLRWHIQLLIHLATAYNPIDRVVQEAA